MFLTLLIISLYDFCPLPDPDVGLSIFVCDVEHTSFHFGLCSTIPETSQSQTKTKYEDSNIMFSRGMTMQCSQLNCDTKHLMTHEPASMFDDRGAMKVSKTKLFFRQI